MICKLGKTHFEYIFQVINDAATAYKGKIPSDCYNEPYMRREEIQQEIDSGVQFYGCIENSTLVAVMGIQVVKDVTLIRHAYTISSHQRQGLGAKLLHFLITLAKTDCVLVGTWASASWAIMFYQNHGFKLLTRQETNKLLHRYWNIPERQVETSVVLKLERP